MSKINRRNDVCLVCKSLSVFVFRFVLSSIVVVVVVVVAIIVTVVNIGSHTI